MGNPPAVTGPLKARDHFLPRDYGVVQAATRRPVKITVPGPMTITDSIADVHYNKNNKHPGARISWPQPECSRRLQR
jgi:methionine synthase II (cobalamin-independent)